MLLAGLLRLVYTYDISLVCAYDDVRNYQPYKYVELF